MKKAKDKRNPPHRFVKGESGNPNGRPKGSFAIYNQLSEAIKEVEKEKKTGLFIHFVDRAFRNDTVLIALLKKLVPDRQNVEGENLQRIIEIVYGYRKQGKIDNSSIRKELGGDSPST
jgi:hypothetical protein